MRVRRWGWKGGAGVMAVSLTLGLAAGCQQKTPTAPASEPGKAPAWGQGFGQQQQPAPAMGAGMPTAEPAAAPQDTAPPSLAAGDLAARGLPNAPSNADQVHGGGGNLTGRVGPSGTDWGGGDLNTGRMAFSSLCARCHGMAGQGGMVGDVGQVPSLASAEFQAKVIDAQIASVVAHGRNKMPSFMGELNGERLRGIVAYVRSLKK